MTDLSPLLNPEQLAAATAPDGPLLVLAAAGTGKTRTLVYRVAHLVERGVRPWNILLLTFTNRAAREMLERAQEVIGPSAGDVWGGTFHSIANRMLRRHADRLGFPRDFRILDADDQKSVLGGIVKSMGYKAKDFVKKDVLLSLISGARNRKLDLADYIAPRERAGSLGAPADEILRAGALYGERKAELQAMDFDDLLVNALRLLRENPDVLADYRARFHHILVDEYQDTNILQSEFVELLAEGRDNLTVVGDDFQCIYTWRGADFRNIMGFQDRHPGTRVVKLERNYRSFPGILELANACIEHNPDQFPKTLRATRPGPADSRPGLVEVYNDAEQTDAILRRIQAARRDGRRWSDIAVLYRSHFHSIQLQIALAREGVPHVTTSGTGVFELAHSKDLLAFFRLAEGLGDPISFTRVLLLMRGMGEATAEKIVGKLGGNLNLREESVRRALVEAMAPRFREPWAGMDALFADYAGATPGAAPLTPQDATARFLDVYYRDALQRTYDRDSAEDRENDVRELAVQIAQARDVRTFLSEVALLTNVDAVASRSSGEGEEGGARDRITLSTVHQAKGLEWPVVFIPWVVDGMFPSSKTLAGENDDGGGDDSEGGDGASSGPSAIAEERRLFYVAVTRARDELTLFVPETRLSYDGGAIPCEPSRFVREVPESLFRAERRYNGGYGGRYGAGDGYRGGGYGGGGYHGGGYRNRFDRSRGYGGGGSSLRGGRNPFSYGG